MGRMKSNWRPLCYVQMREWLLLRATLRLMDVGLMGVQAEAAAAKSEVIPSLEAGGSAGVGKRGSGVPNPADKVLCLNETAPTSSSALPASVRLRWR